jgi:hypothetical protein
MKIDELLKLLHNVKINENKIDERREIAEYLAQTFGSKERQPVYHFMTKDRKIYDFDTYEKLIESNKVSPDDAFVYVENDYLLGYYPASYFYPFFADRYLLPDAYLSKLGLKSDIYRIAPATGLKYVAVVYHFPEVGRTVVEVANIDIVVINTNLPILIYGGIRNDRIDDDEVKEIVLRFSSRELFAGHDFSMANEIIRRYYEDHDISFAKDVAAINYAYSHIFQPYRTEYDLKNKRVIASFERKLF